MKWILALLHKIIAGLISLFLVASPIASIPQKSITLGTANTLIRQEVNITDAYMMSPSGSYATSSEIVAIQDTVYTAPRYYFEVVASTTAGTTASVDLVYASSSKKAATISITGGNTYQRYRSSAFLPIGSSTIEYKVVLNNEAIGKGIIASRVVVLQNSGGGDLNNTETQIEIGSATTTANNTSTLPLQSPKYWYYDSTKWDASPTFYVEATYKDNSVASSSTYGASATTTTTFYKYIASIGVGYVVAEAWGGGGGGDGVTSAATLGGGGGAGGTYAKSTTTSIVAGSTNIIGVGRGGAEGLAAAATASSTVTTSSATVIVRGQGGEGATGEPGGVAGTASSIGDVLFAGGSGGAGETTVDTGGAGGGAGGPDGAGVTPSAATNGVPVAGGAGDNSLGGAGGAAGTGADDVCDTENGKPGVNNVLGGGGGGGGDGDVTSICTGGNGGKPGGGGGGSDEGGDANNQVGGPGQVKITEYIGTVGIALEESDGTGDGFVNWTNKIQIVTAGKTSTTTERVRSVAFTPTSGRNYRITASSTSATGSYNIYNAKIVVDQGGGQGSIVDSVTTGALSINVNGASGTSEAQGQSFTTASAYYIQSVDLKISKSNSPGDSLNVKLLSGSINGTVLATSNNVLGSSLSSSFQFVNFIFTVPISLVSSTKYYLTLQRTGARDTVNTYNWQADGNVYSGGGLYTLSSGSWSGESGANDLDFQTYSVAAPTLLQPQYLLAPFKLPIGTALQTFLTQFDTTEWSTTNAYIAQSEAADGSSSVTGIYTSGGTLVTNSTISTIDNRATSTPICLTATGTYDTKATTNNNDIYAERILVDVGSSQVATCGPVSNNVITTPVTNTQGLININGLITQ